MKTGILLAEYKLIYYILFGILCVSIFILNFIGKKINKFDIAEKSMKYWSVIISISITYTVLFIVTSYLAIFYMTAGVLFNLDFFISLLIPLSLIFGFLTTFTPLFSESRMSFFKTITYAMSDITFKTVSIAIISPLIVSIILMITFFGGKKIYSTTICSLNNGKFSCEYKNGTYEGEMVALMRHGKGIYKWNSGKIYEGEWKNNLMDGQGKLIENGKVITGNWEKHKFIK